MIVGECNCREVQFKILSKPSGVYICHCSICRRHTGTNGNAVLVVAKVDFKWISGEEKISSWKKPGHDWQIWFCSTCGSQLPGENDDSRAFVPVGLLTSGDENLKVIHHIWVDSKASWDEIGDSGKQHMEAFEG